MKKSSAEKIKKVTGFVTSASGQKVYYESRGEGRPLVFLYGIGCLFNHFHFQSDYFSKNYQVIFCDYPGHGKTKPPKVAEEAGLELITENLLAVLDKLKINKATFVTHSFGSQVLFDFYKHHPEKVELACIFNGFAKNPFQDMFQSEIPIKLLNLVQQLEKKLPETTQYLWTVATDNPVMPFVFSLAGGFNLFLSELKDIQIYGKNLSNLHLRTFLTLMEKMSHYNATPTLKSFSVPALIVGGEKDLVTPVKHQRSLAKHIKNSTLKIFKEGTHCAQLDLPKEANEAIEIFLKKHKY